MANIRKQFNFRNGVQVDDDNLIVTSTGLVGIGTSIPNEALDVRGTAKVVGLMTATEVFTPNLTALSANISNLTLGQSIIGSGVSIRSGIITASGSGVVTYFGDGARLLNLPTSQWLDIDVGLGFTSIYAQGFVGVGTVDPRFVFQVAGTPDTSLAGFANGVGISSSGNILATGIVTASQFYGIGSNLTLINASNISSGTLNNDRLPQNINISGILTASTSITSGNINASGIVTASSELVAGKVTVNGNATVSGILTVTGNVTGNLVGIASTARTLTGNPDILVNNVTATSIAVTSITNVTSIGATNINITGIVTSQSLHIGIGGTALSITTNSKLGIGSVTPDRDLQILKTDLAEIELVGSNQAQIILGQKKTPTIGVGVGDSTAVIRFGNTNRAFDLINGDQGDFNYYLHSGFPVAGVTTGSFNWFYGQNIAAPLLTLTFGGNLGIAKTNPDHKLHVVGTSTVTGNAFFGNDVNISGNLTVSGSLSGNIFAVEAGRVNQTSGVSTVARLQTSSIIVAVGSSIGIGTTAPIAAIDAREKLCLFGNIGIGTTTTTQSLQVSVGSAVFDHVAIGNTVETVGDTLRIFDGTTVLSGNTLSGINSCIFLIDNTCSIGIGTTLNRSAVDFGDAGTGSFGGAGSYMIVPRVTNAVRGLFANTALGIATATGAVIYNTTNNQFQGYDGGSWTNLGITTSNINANQINVSGVTTVSELKVGTGVTINSGIVTATNGFLSGIGTAVKITTSGNQLIFTVPGVGSTSFTLS